MKFGLFLLLSRPEGHQDQEVLTNGIEYARRAEALGFDCVWLAEHHFVPYGLCGSPLIMASHLAAHTNSIRLGMAVSVLPFQHPLRTVEDAALVDVLSGGRLDFGVGRGYSAIEYTGFGINMDESRERFRECLDVIRLAWTSHEPFTYDGVYYKVPGRIVNPRPLQTEPPIWVAATSPSTLTWAAEQGYPYLQDHMSPFEALTNGRHVYRSALLESGSETALAEQLLAQSAVLRMVYVADRDNSAVDDARPRLKWYQDSLVRFGSSARDGSYSKAYEYQRRLNEQQHERDFDWYHENATLFGSPARVTDRLQQLSEQCNLERVICWMSFGGMPREKVFRSMETFAERVMPRLG